MTSLDLGPQHREALNRPRSHKKQNKKSKPPSPSPQVHRWHCYQIHRWGFLGSSRNASFSDQGLDLFVADWVQQLLIPRFGGRARREVHCIFLQEFFGIQRSKTNLQAAPHLLVTVSVLRQREQLSSHGLARNLKAVAMAIRPVSLASMSFKAAITVKAGIV